MDKVKFFGLLPEFKKAWIHGNKVKFSIQRFNKTTNELEYHDQKRALTDQDWFTHFSGRPVDSKAFVSGSLAICGAFEDDIVKWICWDGDKQEEVEWVMNKLIPWLEKNGIDYIFEFSANGRCHLWVMVDALLQVVAWSFVNQIHEDTGGRTGECYPFGSRRQAVIRPPGGYHWRAKCVNDILWNGEQSNDPCFMLEAITNARKVTEDVAKALIRTKIPDAPVKIKKERQLFRYFPRDLKLPFDNLPNFLSSYASQCESFNKRLQGIRDNALIEIPGIEYHDIGLDVSGAAAYGDIVDKTDLNMRWFDWAAAEFRSRPKDSHGWNENIKKYEDDPRPLIKNCKTQDEMFNMCGNCPYKNMEEFGFWNPRQFRSDSHVKMIEKTKVGETNLVTLADIREKTFPAVRARILELNAKQERADILIASPQGSGKSVFTDEIAVQMITQAMDLANQGMNIVIAVPNGELMVEHMERIRQRGGNALGLSSHKSTFDKRNLFKLDFVCPYYDDIQYYYELGAESSYFKKKYCKTCPHFEACPFPRQYAEAALPEARIVIIQHAHFQCPEILYQLFNTKQFDVMFIDESFVNNVLVRVKPTAIEIAILEASNFSWAPALVQWLKNGGYPSGKIYPNIGQLEELKMAFDNAEQPWRLRNFIDGFNQNHYMNKVAGLRMFYPIPEIPIRVLTDATPPIQMLEIILDNKNIEVFGEGEVIDVQAYHPENEVIQIIDAHISKTALAKNELFFEFLNKIGEDAQTKFEDDKILVTVYKSHQKEAIEYMREKFPVLDIGDKVTNRICVNTMTIGVNTYSEFTIQYLLASVYPNGRDLVKGDYELTFIKNYWRTRKGLDPLPNIYIEGIDDPSKTIQVEMRDAPTRKVCRDGIYEYSGIFQKIPQYDLALYTYFNMIAKGIQAGRIRFNPEIDAKGNPILNEFGKPFMKKRKKLFICGNQNHKGIACTKVVTYVNYLGGS